MRLTAAPRRAWRRRSTLAPGDDAGASTVELVLSVPALLLIALFLMMCGRLVSIQLDVDAAVHAAARAATLARTPALARQDALAAAQTTLAGRTSCPQPAVTVDTSAFRPGGTVTVVVTCQVPLRDLAGVGVGGSKRVTARTTSPLDVYRGAS
ncbi:TadE/TadG family type IV pilus assembly protein [Actinoplanes sp. NPDC051475]|uniref:TadE/TadG family type IV pilus assembly protein n=1 Tax=Actinoplanes sp. NPDC051475 TaxID=3157225 RepID=UPI00344CB2CC